MSGKKFDNGKAPWDLLPLPLIRPVLDVLAHGAAKYGGWNWQQVAEGERRYQAAMMRHIEAWQRGQIFDPESKLPHLAHVACNAIFLLWFQAEDANVVRDHSGTNGKQALAGQEHADRGWQADGRMDH